MKSVLKKYKNNELSAAQQAELEEKLMTELFEQRARGEWKTKLDEQGIRRNQPSLTVEKKGASNSWRWLMAAASIALLVAVGIQFLGSPKQTLGSSESLLAVYTKERSENFGVRMGDDPWGEAKGYFSDKKFAKAAIEVEKLGATMNPEQQYFLGICYFYEKNFAKAAANLQTVAAKNDMKASESRWYLALSQLQLGQKVAAVQQLEALAAEKDYRWKEATDLLKEIK